MYHRADLDGVLSGAIAYDNLVKDPLNDVYLIGSDYGDDFKSMNLDKYEKIYMVDFSDDWILTHPIISKRVIWIDHHLSAIAKNYKVSQYCINGVAACRLVYQYFNNPNWSFLTDLDYFNRGSERMPNEPYLVTLAGEYDIWDQTSPIAKYINKGIPDISFDNVHLIWTMLRFVHDKPKAKDNDKKYIEDRKSKQGYDLLYTYLMRGEGAVAFIGTTEIACSGGVPVTIMGKKGYAYNTHIRTSLIAKQKEDFTMVWNYTGGNNIKISLYSETIDASKIAVAFGGGGHRGACGFSVMPHILTQILTTGYP